MYQVPWAVYLEKSTYELNTYTLCHFFDSLSCLLEKLMYFKNFVTALVY